MKKQASRSNSQSKSNFKHKSVKPNKTRSISTGKPNKSASKSKFNKSKFSKSNKNNYNNA
jgi:hypothetical protein